MASAFKRFKKLIIDLLNEGKSVSELSIAISIGMLLGIFPVLGVTTVTCIALGKIFKLNIPTLLAANYVVFPIQVVMIYALIKTGEFIFNLENQIDYEFFKTLLEEDLLVIVQTLGYNLLAAVASWTLLGLILYLPLYNMSKAVLIRTKLRKTA